MLPPSIPKVHPADTAWLTEAEMREVDRLMIDVVGIELLQMMENAGRSLARLTLARFAPTTVSVLAGTGGNGGGGLVAARHLVNAGVQVEVALTKPPLALAPAARHQHDALVAMGVSIAVGPPAGDHDVVLDAIIGYSLGGAPRSGAAELIGWAAASSGAVIALDTPSGLDVTAGTAPGAVVDADLTLTLALPKRGLRDHPAVGELDLADISVPQIVYDTMAVGPIPSFRSSPVLRIEPAATAEADPDGGSP